MSFKLWKVIFMNGRREIIKIEELMGVKGVRTKVIFGGGREGKKGVCSSFSSCNDNRISELKRGKVVTIIQWIGYYQKTLNINHFSNEIVS